MTRSEQISVKKERHISIVYRNCKQIVESEFLKDLSYVQFNKVEYVEDPNDAFKIWYNLFNEILNKHAPIVTKRVKRDKQSEWYNTEVQYDREMRDTFKKLDMWDEYKFWRNRTKQILDEAKQNFYNNMLNESKDPKIIWKCIHSLNP
jgi:hypothetical protein